MDLFAHVVGGKSLLHVANVLRPYFCRNFPLSESIVKLLFYLQAQMGSDHD